MSYVALVATGGTVASTKSEYGATVGVSADGFDLFDDPQIEVKRFDALSEGSYRLGFANLATVHQKVSEIQADPDCRGVVVTHGTDTMEETAYFLDLTLPSEQPVVVTGAQRTFDTEDADGPRNIRDAVAVAASPRTRGLGTLVCFAGNIWAAQGVRKAHTIQVQAFNGLKVGEVNEGECVPARADSPFAGTAPSDSGMMHQEILCKLGLPLGELWKLDELSAECARRKQWEVFPTLKPLNIPGAKGSPANAMAIF